MNCKKLQTCTEKHKSVSVQKVPLENTVVAAVKAKIVDDNFIEYIADMMMELQGQENRLLPVLQQRLAETERGIDNLLNAIQNGAFNDSIKQRLDKLEQAKKDIDLQIIQEEMRHPVLSREDVTYWLYRFRTLDISVREERRRLIDSFVNSVTVFDDYILITFNHKEGAERITFDAIKSSDLKLNAGPWESPRTTRVLGLFFFIFHWLVFDFSNCFLTLRGQISGQLFRRILFPGSVQMPVDVGGHLNVRVSHPFLNILEGESGIEQQACAAVTKFVQTYVRHTVLFQQSEELNRIAPSESQHLTALSNKTVNNRNKLS